MSTKTVAAWDNRSAPAGATNTLRGLTHSTDSTREGLLVESTRVCSIDGCDRTPRVRAMCQMHYMRTLRATVPIDSPPRVRIETLAELLSHTRPEGECMVWTASTWNSGYGKRGSRLTHRMAYELAYGPIPEGLLVCHRCDNPPCCNPAHLFLGTASDNMQDMVRKGRHPNKSKTHCPHGHAYDEANTYIESGGGRSCRACASAVSARARAQKTITTEMDDAR